MARTGGWRRVGSKGRFRYLDSRGKRITDPGKISRIEALVIPPAWRHVRISPRPSAKLQATGVDAAGRPQYLYHVEYRAAQEQVKFDKLIQFAERLPDLRAAMAKHIELESLERERVSADALRLINLGWFRVGSDRYAQSSKTYEISTLERGTSRCVEAASRSAFRERVAGGFGRPSLIPSLQGRFAIFAHCGVGGGCFGTGPTIASWKPNRKAATTSTSRRTIEDFRRRHLRDVGARDIGLDQEEQALLRLLRSWRIRRSRAAA